ncbi:MAG: hypothetical protein A2W77_03430 [Nitrospinae bacterium RIFCSPLOWO2_12_39_16]|nr:MAG: hypothetical protein A2W77_03430 [Nitrospinae bacterium RIFCSPLOWO2_12_39_16]
MNSGKTNIKFGFLWITLATFLGFILAIKMQTGGEEWQKSPIKGYWSVAHVHANTLAILNILYGLFIGRVGLGDSARKLGSNLALAGMIIMPLGLFLVPFIQPIGYLIPLGEWCIIISMGMMAAGAFKSIN